MTYQVLARKWRPQVFDAVVGQDPVTRTLRNALASGRVAHAYLFTGPRGVGKTTTARLLAKALACTARTGPEACGACPSCKDFVSGAPVDVMEIDAAYCDVIVRRWEEFTGRKAERRAAPEAAESQAAGEAMS